MEEGIKSFIYSTSFIFNITRLVINGQTAVLIAKREREKKDKEKGRERFKSILISHFINRLRKLKSLFFFNHILAIYSLFKIQLT